MRKIGQPFLLELETLREWLSAMEFVLECELYSLSARHEQLYMARSQGGPYCARTWLHKRHAALEGSVLKIYGYAESINVRKVLWMCAELELPFVREDWGGAFRSTSEPRFRALNPVGMVPVIDDGGVIVWESNVIIRYLATSRGRTDLAPADPASRAHMEQWMDWQASDFNNSWRVAFQGLVRRNPACQDRAAIDASGNLFSSMVGMVDAQLGSTDAYVVGNTFTLADIVIGLSLHRWRSLPMIRPHYPNVERYYERLLEREGFRRHGRDGGP